MSEGQPIYRKPNVLRTAAMAGVLAVTGVIGAPLTSRDAMGAMVEPSTTATNTTLDATCTPIRYGSWSKSDTLRSVTGQRAILVGDITVANKGLIPDKKANTREMTVIDLPASGKITGILSDKGGTSWEIFNSCASKTLFQSEIGRLARINTPSGDAESYIAVHRITKVGAEPHVTPEPACTTTWIGKELPATSDSGTETFNNIKRAVLTGDINVQNAKRDDNTDSGETIIVDFPSVGDLTGINAPWGGYSKVMTDCASKEDFYEVIGQTQVEKASQYSDGQQTFYINTP